MPVNELKAGLWVSCHFTDLNVPNDWRPALFFGEMLCSLAVGIDTNELAAPYIVDINLPMAMLLSSIHQNDGRSWLSRFGF